MKRADKTWKERLMIHKQEDVGGRARITTEQKLLRVGAEPRSGCADNWVVVSTSYHSDRQEFVFDVLTLRHDKLEVRSDVTEFLTSCGLRGESITPWGRGLSGLAIEKAHPHCLLVSSLKGINTRCIHHISWSKLLNYSSDALFCYYVMSVCVFTLLIVSMHISILDK